MDGDIPLLNLFKNCSTEEERLDALLAGPSPFARMALETFSRRTRPRPSTNSSFDTHEPVVHMRTMTEDSKEDNEESLRAVRDSHVKDPEADERDHGDMSEEGQVMQRLIEGCNP